VAAGIPISWQCLYDQSRFDLFSDQVKKRLSKELRPQALPGQQSSSSSQSLQAFQQALDRAYRELEGQYREILKAAKLA